MRERLNCVAFSARADAICFGSTIDGTIDENDGIDNASVTPTIAESTITIQGRTVPVSSSTTSRNGQSIWIDWHRVMMRRRSLRSASTPPISVNIQTGAAVANESRPIKNDDAPRLSRSHGSATCCAHVPRLDRRLAKQNVPKRRVRRR